MTDKVKKISAWIGAIMAFVALMTLIVGGLRALDRFSDVPDQLVVIVQHCAELEHGVVMALRYSIKRSHRDYMTAGEISRTALDYFLNLYEAHQRLSDYAFISALVAEVRALPFEAYR